MDVVKPTNHTKVKKSKKKNTPDIILIAIIIAIVAFGIVMVYSASFNYCTRKGWEPTKLAVQQGIFALAGIAGMIFIGFKFDYHMLTNRRLVCIIYGVSTLMAASVRLIGVERNGAKRWIEIFGIGFQPSEFVKVAVILMLSSFIIRNKGQMNSMKNIIIGWLIALFPAGVVAIIGSNLSSGLVIAGIGAVIMFCCSGNLKVYALLVVMGLGIVFGVKELARVTPPGKDPNIPIVDKILSGYRLDRIRVWEDPWIDPVKDGYQPVQALLAVGSGGIFGVGLGSGIQKLGFVPEPYNDIIFAVICEELGLIGAICLLSTYAFLFLRGMRVAFKARDFSGTIIAIGVSSMVGMQAIINVAVNTNLVPTTGMQLPLISYGGTALIALLGSLGLLISVSRNTTV